MSNPKTCDSTTLAGPFSQTLFLGCSVVSFTANAGWGGETTNLTVRLIKDTCVGATRIFYTTSLRYAITTNADPGFMGLTQDIIGCPAYFRVGDFEFCGLIQSWEEEKSTSGNPIYNVVLSDPRLLLENSKIILSKYAGSVQSLPNVFNVYGFLESVGTINAPPLSLVNGAYSVDSELFPVCIDGPTFGSPAYHYGGALNNNNGILWTQLLNGLNVLCNRNPKLLNQWSPYGRILYRGCNTGDYGLLRSDRAVPISNGGIISMVRHSEYMIDFSDLPIPPTYWRIAGDSIDILTLITSLCDAAGYDFYIELIPVRSNISSSGVVKIIKIRTVRRTTQPSLTTISNFIGDGSGTISVKKGVELRNETTSAICFGGAKETLYQITNDYFDPLTNTDINDIILPYFGLEPLTNNTIVPVLDDVFNQWIIDVDATWINTNLTSSGVNFVGDLINGSRYAYITETEMMAALAGFDQWTEMISVLANAVGGDGRAKSSIGVALSGLISKTDVNNMFAYMEGDAGLQVGHLQLHPPTKTLLPDAIDGYLEERAFKQQWEDAHTLHQWVLSFAERLGKSFQVRVPYTCARIDEENAQILISEYPTDGGWTEQNILGIARNSPYLGFFQHEDNRINALIVLNDTSTSSIPKDVSFLGDTYGILGDKIYIKAQVDPEYVFENKLTATGPRAVLNIAGGVPILNDAFLNPNSGIADNTLSAHTRHLIMCADAYRHTYDKSAGWFENTKTKLIELDKQAGSKTTKNYFPYTYDTVPYGAAFGIHSNLLTYGPWFKLGLMGGTKIEQDEGLVPWEYNSYQYMNIAGQSKADEGLTNMQAGEKGEITVPGYPTLPLGAELGAVAGGLFAAGSQCVKNRTISLTSVNVGTSKKNSCVSWKSPGRWTGAYGPNITSINVSISTQGIQTTYTMSTYTPKFGRFTKYNADRLKQVGQLSLKAQKVFSNRFLLASKASFNSELRGGQRNYRLNLQDVGIMGLSQTAHPLLVGSMSNTINGYKFTNVVTEPFSDVYSELAGYENKAFMSLEGLLRPISLYGDGGLPRLATPLNTATDLATPLGAQFPVYNSGTPEYWLQISNSYLQPLQNPGDDATLRSSGTCSSGVGHDFLILGRESGYPSGSQGQGLIIPNFSGETTNDYAEDYRLLALRGPLLMQSWGYDTDGKPIPNAADNVTDASGGTFTATNLQDNFLDSWLRKPQTWPVAPVDLRYDRQRGVWVSPPSYSMMLGTISGGLGPKSNGTAFILDGPTIYNSGGQVIDYSTSGVTVPVSNKLDVSYSSGDLAYIVYNNKVDEFWIFGGTSLGVAWATTTGDVCPADSTFNVTDLKLGNGSTWDTTGIVKNSPDNYTIAAGTRGKIIFMYDDDSEWAWHPLDFDYDCENSC
jgi:hypothetical protein